MDLLCVSLESFAVELGVVHLAEVIDEFLEELAALLEVLEVEIDAADVQNEIQHVFLTVHRTEGVGLVESVLLEEHEVDEF